MIPGVESFLEQYHMIEQSDVVVAGVSGGADSVCLLLHLLGIGLGSTCHEVAGTLHTHAHCHVRLSGTGSIRAGGLKSLCHSRLYKAFPYRGVAHHGTLIPHVDELSLIHISEPTRP